MLNVTANHEGLTLTFGGRTYHAAPAAGGGATLTAASPATLSHGGAAITVTPAGAGGALVSYPSFTRFNRTTGQPVVTAASEGLAEGSPAGYFAGGAEPYPALTAALVAAYPYLAAGNVAAAGQAAQAAGRR